MAWEVRLELKLGEGQPAHHRELGEMAWEVRLELKLTYPLNTGYFTLTVKWLGKSAWN